MKKYIILLLAASAIMQVSCNKNLDPKVYSTLTSTNAFKTESDAVELLFLSSSHRNQLTSTNRHQYSGRHS